MAEIGKPGAHRRGKFPKVRRSAKRAEARQEAKVEYDRLMARNQPQQE